MIAAGAYSYQAHPRRAGGSGTVLQGGDPRGFPLLMKMGSQLLGLICLLALLGAGGPAHAQQEGFGGDEDQQAGPGADIASPEGPTEAVGSTDASDASSPGTSDRAPEGAAQPSGEGQADGAPDIASTAPEALKQEPNDPLAEAEEIYPDAPQSEAPPAILQKEGDKGHPGRETNDPKGRKERRYAPTGKQAVARPLVEPDPNPPPDGWSNWTASALQYGTGLCSACGCCGSSGIIGGVALAAGIVIPGGSILFGPLVGCLGCVSIVGAPAVGTSASVVLREWLGIWRGPLLWALLASYAVELIAVGVIAAGVLAASWLLTNFVASVRGPSGGLFDINPADQWAWGQAGLGAGVFASSFVAGLIFAIVSPSAAATLTYQLLGEQKNHFDIGFRMPGLWSPNHPDPPKVVKPDSKGHERNRASPAPEPASMRF